MSFLESPEYAFISTMNWMSRWSATLLGPLGLLGVHAHTMARLAETPGLTQSELAEQIHRDAPTTSRVVDDMIDMGLLERRMDAKDRRRRRIHFTTRGRRLHARVQQRFAEARELAGIKLGAHDVAALWRVADHLQERYRAVLTDGADGARAKAG